MNNEAAAIVGHYLRQLTARSGLRWTEANERDMQRLSVVLGQDAPLDTRIPPFAPDERATVVLERDPAASDANYQEWRRRQADEASVRRMTRR